MTIKHSFQPFHSLNMCATQTHIQLHIRKFTTANNKEQGTESIYSKIFQRKESGGIEKRCGKIKCYENLE